MFLATKLVRDAKRIIAIYAIGTQSNNASNALSITNLNLLSTLFNSYEPIQENYTINIQIMHHFCYNIGTIWDF